MITDQIKYDILNARSEALDVLIIEDDKENRLLLCEMLAGAESALFNVETADRMQTALEQLAGGDVDLILLDLDLPNSSGLDTLDRLRDHAPDVPIIVLINANNETLGVRAQQDGAQDYLVKERMNNDLLTRAIRYVVEQQQILAELKRCKQIQAGQGTNYCDVEQEQRERELQQFAYAASHDLQEPLRMVTSYVQLLAQRYKGRLGVDADDFIAYTEDGINRIQNLIDDLLIYSRVGIRDREFESTDCADVIDRALTILRPMIEENGAVVSYGVLPAVAADRPQLIRLFQNLISNAIKFRSEKPPCIHIAAERKNNEWIFSIRDNGIGIDPDYADRIFVIFQRLHSREKYQGTGIGLAMCKKIVEYHGGRIWVESLPGAGAAFYFTIPAL